VAKRTKTDPATEPADFSNAQPGQGFGGSEASGEATATVDPATADPVATPAPGDIIVSPVVDAIFAAGQQKFKTTDMFFGDELEDRMFVVEITALALQWLIDSNGWPLQSMVTLSGFPKSMKSSASQMIGTHFIREPYGGGAVIVHNEGKFSPSKLRAIARDMAKRFLVQGRGSVEDSQEALSFYVDALRAQRERIHKALKAKKADLEKDAELRALRESHLYPFCLILDSLTGSQTEEMIGKVADEGHGVGRTFQDRSLVVTTFMNATVPRLIGLPVMFLSVNHLKEAPVSNGPPGATKRYNPGGVAPGFFTSLDIQTRRQDEKSSGGRKIVNLQWYVNHSSIGRDHRKITVPYVETYGEQNQQLDYFDWDSALVLLLEQLSGDGVYSDLKEYAGLRRIERRGGDVFVCKCMGIDEDQALEGDWTSEKLGYALQQDADIRDRLQYLLRIQKHKLFTADCPLAKGL
jgi:hypothetical protein